MKTIQRIAAFSCFVLLCGVATLDGTSPLKMDVSPSVSRAPGAVKVRVTVTSAPQDRALLVVAQSPNFYRSSEVQLEGTDSSPINVFEFRDLPSGLYQITGTLVTANGPRATVLRLAKVDPGIGSE